MEKQNMQNIDRNHPLWMTFYDEMHTTVSELGLADQGVEEYLTNLLVAFVHQDNIFRIQDAFGRRVESIAGLLAEADIRINATSFDRERQVHKHIGDFLLFWTGVFPNGLKTLDVSDSLIDVDALAKDSYRIAASFEHPPYHLESQVLQRLSYDFEGYRFGLSRLRLAA